MNHKFNMFSDWSEVTSGERNQLVFEHLNKSYGAFNIRTNYDRTLLKSLFPVLLAILFVSGLSFFPTTIKPVSIIPDTPPVLQDLPPVELPKTIPPDPPRSPISTPEKPAVLSPPIITSDSILPDDDKPFPAPSTGRSTGNPDDSNDTYLNASHGGDVINAPKPPIDTVYEDVMVKPEFPGGDKELFKFLRSNTRIPESIINSGPVNEKIGVVFIVDKDGSVTSASLHLGGSKYSELNKEAIRVINKMPRWEPGKQHGNNVKVRMILPFRFEVKN